MTLRPLYDRVVLKRKEAEATTVGGLFIPTNAQEKSNLAVVVSVGTGRVSDEGVLTPLQVEPGMTVLLGKWAGDLVQIEGVDHLIVRESDILSVVE